MTVSKTETLHFTSIETFQEFLKDIYQKEGMSGVETFVKTQLNAGRKVSFEKGTNGIKNQNIEICDRHMFLLDSNGINIVNNNFIPTINIIDFDKCELFLSQRIILVDKPFGITIFSKRHN